MAGRDGTVQSVERAINILEELSKEEDGCGVTYLANVTGLPKSTVHRLIITLTNIGYVEKDISSDKYKLSVKILSLAANVLERMDIRRIAKPYIEKLSDRVGEVVHIGILDKDQVVYIDKVEKSKSSIRMYSQIGKRAPLYCTGLGKVLISGLMDKEIESLIKEEDMVKFTESTITTMEKLKQEVDKIRKSGYAVDEIEHEKGIRCVAAPIYDMEGNIIAAISIAGPTVYITKERLPEIIKELLNTSKKISYQLGYLRSI